jgi:antitoxin PrlF
MIKELDKWATVTKKGQVTVPKTIRDRIGISEGGRVRFRLRYDGLVIMETNKTHSDLYGQLSKYAYTAKPVDTYALREKIADERAKELGY